MKECSKCTLLSGCKGVWKESCKGPHLDGLKMKDEEHYKGINRRGKWSDLIYDETGISNPDVVIAIIKRYGKIRGWIQSLDSPDLIWRKLSSMFSKRIDTAKSDIGRKE